MSGRNDSPTKPIAIIQARMNSQRLPGKVLSEVNGKPLLQYLVDSVKQCQSLDGIIVATSIEKADDPVAHFCHRCNINYYRGQSEDVASRYKDIIESYKLNVFVRLCADSPLLDYRLIDSAVNVYQKGQHDIVTNVFPRSFPKGQSIEIVNAKTFLNGYACFDAKEDFEHVTGFFYRNSGQFNINNIALDHDFSNIRFCVDTPEDLEVFQRVVSGMDKPHWEYCWEKIIEIYHQVTAESIH